MSILPKEERERLAEACLDTFDSLCRRQLEKSAEESGLSFNSPEPATATPVLTTSR